MQYLSLWESVHGYIHGQLDHPFYNTKLDRARAPIENEHMTAALTEHDRLRRRIALKFIVLIGVLSFFADFVYEGSRSVLGPYLALLGASGAVVGVVTGLGELLGYGLRLVSGRFADATGRYWPITIFGYAI